MSLDPRAIAVQGIGFTPLLVAVQGLLAASPGPTPPPSPSLLGGPGFIVNVGRMMGR